ncbi:unnamed protein product [Heligmosomoides polygyrus]|uniref:Exosome complex component RRP43 n=1 Tax=Heligmosomoides polygyrus TaxID=6339 RepID=A0A183GFI9_HELPZ|nr:unnamed protein product [Heligmosomoides polygyrus]
MQLQYSAPTYTIEVGQHSLRLADARCYEREFVSEAKMRDLGSEEVFIEACNSRGVGGVGVLVNTHLFTNIHSYECLTSRIGRLRLKRCGSVQALTVFVAYAPTSDYDDEDVEAFYVDLGKFYKEDDAFFKVIVGVFNVIGREGCVKKRSPRFGVERARGKAV